MKLILISQDEVNQQPIAVFAAYWSNDDVHLKNVGSKMWWRLIPGNVTTDTSHVDQHD